MAHHVLPMGHRSRVQDASRLAQVVRRNSRRWIMMCPAGHWRWRLRDHCRTPTQSNPRPCTCRCPRLIRTRGNLHRLQALQFLQVKVKDRAVVKVALHLKARRRLQLMHAQLLMRLQERKHLLRTAVHQHGARSDAVESALAPQKLLLLLLGRLEQGRRWNRRKTNGREVGQVVEGCRATAHTVVATGVRAAHSPGRDVRGWHSTAAAWMIGTVVVMIVGLMTIGTGRDANPGRHLVLVLVEVGVHSLHIIVVVAVDVVLVLLLLLR